MGSRAVGKRLRQLRMLPLIAASLVMVLASVPALAEQATDVVPADPATPPGQDDPASESPRGAPGVCDHAAGEFLVGYTSEEALRTAPPDNVVDTFGGILAQHLAFEEIKNIPDPAERLVTEEAKRQELGARPGVAYAEYNCVATAQAASAERAADLPTPASCGDCGRYVVDRAKEVIADGFGDAEGRDAFDAALEAARSTGTDDENVAFASKIELDEASADGGSDGNSESSSADGDSASEGNDADDSASDDAVSGGSGAGGAGGKAADDDESGAEEEADGEESSSGDTEDETEGEDNASAGPEPVAGKNVAATTSVPREAGGTGGKVMALGAGALLLAAGVYVARRTFWG
jgi:hypothetical protein